MTEEKMGVWKDGKTTIYWTDKRKGRTSGRQI